MFDKNIFSQRLIGLIKENAVTSKYVADSIGVSKQALNQIEKQVSLPSVNTLLSLANYFDVSIDYLVGRSDDPKRY